MPCRGHPARPAHIFYYEIRASVTALWEPPSGMVKRSCRWCRYLFAAPQDAVERRCPDCVGLGSRPHSSVILIAGALLLSGVGARPPPDGV